MSLILIFTRKWNRWYSVLRYRKGFGMFDSVRYGLWLARGSACGLAMAGTRMANGQLALRPAFAGVHATRSLLKIETWMPSEIKAISPLVDRVMRLIEGSRCAAGNETAVELPLREALSNAVVHGKRMDAHKLVQIRCQCELGKGVSIIVTDHGPGIHLMKLAMDEVWFERGGTEVHMRKGPARSPRTALRRISESANGGPSNNIQRGAALADTQADAVGRHERWAC
jgi:serine/threonine-protein kinase RsbW